MNGEETGDQHGSQSGNQYGSQSGSLPGGESDDWFGNPVEERMIALETADSYHQRAIDESAAQIYQLAQKVDRLEKIVAKMTEKVKEMAQEKEPSLPVNERPPHY